MSWPTSAYGNFIPDAPTALIYTRFFEGSFCWTYLQSAIDGSLSSFQLINPANNVVSPSVDSVQYALQV